MPVHLAVVFFKTRDMRFKWLGGCNHSRLVCKIETYQKMGNTSPKIQGPFHLLNFLKVSRNDVCRDSFSFFIDYGPSVTNKEQ